MSRWDPGDKKEMLQQIADDERRPTRERDAARRELETAAQPAPTSPRRHGRSSNVPITQADQDSDIERDYRLLHDGQLTTQDQIDFRRGLDESTQAILGSFASPVLDLFANNDAEIVLLIDLHGRTQSHFVRAKAMQTIGWIADYSPIESAKMKAQEFLTQLDRKEQNEQPPAGPEN
jgi:hypothetical protein